MMLKKRSELWLVANKWLIILLILGTLSWSLTMIKSGIVYPFGVGFWGPNGHDGIWHIALANSLARGSLEMPVFAGEALKNYHIGFDLIIALLHKLTTIPTHTLYFQILPPLIAFSVGALTYFFVMQWKKSKIQALWAVFFVYFGGSWGWILGKGESAFWAQQAVSTLLNPPFALSLVVILLGLLCLQKKKKILAILLFGILIQIKAYAGVLALVALLLSGQWMVFMGSLVLSIILFLPLNTGSTSLLVFQPFWFLETMMALSDRVGWPKYYEAMFNYRAGNSPKALLAYPVAFAIFWFGNLGTRVIKEILVLRWLRNRKLIGKMEIFVASIIVFGVAIPMLFLQKGTPWNTIQFLYYALFFSSILTGCVVGEFFAKRKSIVLAAALVLFTIPTTFMSLWYHYLPSRPPAKISNAEIDALQFLSSQKQGIVFTFPFDKAKADEAVSNPPRPLYLYESTAYVAAFSNKPVYLEDQVNLDITGFGWPARRKAIEDFYKSTDQKFVYEFLRKQNIRYVYWLKGQRATLGETQLGIERIFENSEVDIYIVKT